MNRPTTHHGNADALPHLLVGHDKDFDTSEMSCCQIDAQEDSLLHSFPLDYRKIVWATETDPYLRILLHYICTEWLCSQRDIENSLVCRYFARRNELLVHKGVILVSTDSEHSRVFNSTTFAERSIELTSPRTLGKGWY